MSLNSSVLLLLSFSALALCQLVVQKNDGHSGHFVHGPAYLANLTKELRKEYFSIYKAKDLTIKQQEEKKLAFAKAHGFEEEIKKDLADKEVHSTQVKKERPELIKSLAAANDELIKIYENKDQTLAQQQQAVDKLSEKYPNAVPTLYYMSRMITGKKIHSKKHLNKKD